MNVPVYSGMLAVGGYGIGGVLAWTGLILSALGVGSAIIAWLAGVRYIPHDRVGVVEKWWSSRGSLGEGRILALGGEAGFQAEILRGGAHGGFFPWQYRIHQMPLVTVGEGQIGYVYARDGQPLQPMHTLGVTVPCNYYQDARAFLTGGGQRGRQRAILREGVYAINLAQFVVITMERVYGGLLRGQEQAQLQQWHAELAERDGFRPVLIGSSESVTTAPRLPGEKRDGETQLSSNDTLGVVTVHDGAPIASGEIIAPEIPASESGDHNYFQDPDMFLALGGRRGKQLQVLTDGTFFINRWFATVEIKPKTLIPIGYVGVVVSYYGVRGVDVTGQAFRYGEQVAANERGVWKQALAPGKYALNPYALKVELVPTINFVLRWVTGQVEAHQYDKDLTSIELITADGYEPMLPLSLVLHIDYEKAPSVVQRFGDVRRLISQTLDPILTSYFRDVAQSSHMLDLLTKREEIQARATEELGRRFQQYDINCIAVMIGRPESKPGIQGVEPIEQLFDQLRLRRLAEEQKETFAKQQEAAFQLKQLNEAQAIANKQAELTQTKIHIEIAANQGEAQLAEARGLARRDVELAQGQSKSQEMLGRGEAARTAQIGLAEAAVSLQKVRALGDPRLYAMNLIAQQLAQSVQPLVPERLLVMGESGREGGGAQGYGLFQQLMALMLSEKAGVSLEENEKAAAEIQKSIKAMQQQFAATPAAQPN